jgi:hypothetical protein
MADPPSARDPGNGTGVGSDRGSTTSTPRWVKVFGIILGVLVLLFVIMTLFGDHLGGHGPGRHGGGHG